VTTPGLLYLPSRVPYANSFPLLLLLYTSLFLSVFNCGTAGEGLCCGDTFIAASRSLHVNVGHTMLNLEYSDQVHYPDRRFVHNIILMTQYLAQTLTLNLTLNVIRNANGPEVCTRPEYSCNHTVFMVHATHPSSLSSMSDFVLASTEASSSNCFKTSINKLVFTPVRFLFSFFIFFL